MFVNRKLGSQHTFSQIDGEAGSLSGSENCSSTTEQQKEREEEKGEEEEKKEKELEATGLDPNRCLRPLQRARERRAARLKEESDAVAEIDPDPHVPRVNLGYACWGCNVAGADIDWYQHGLHEGIGICMPCMDSDLGRNLLLTAARRHCSVLQLIITLEESQNSQ